MATSGILSRRYKAWESQLDISSKIQSGYKYTPEEAKSEFGLDIPEGWSITPSSIDDEGYIKFSQTTPEGWQITSEGRYISPSGQTYTKDYIEQQQSAIESLEPYQVGEGYYDFGAALAGGIPRESLAGIFGETAISDYETYQAYQESIGPSIVSGFYDWVAEHPDYSGLSVYEDVENYYSVLQKYLPEGIEDTDTVSALKSIRELAATDEVSFLDWVGSIDNTVRLNQILSFVFPELEDADIQSIADVGYALVASDIIIDNVRALGIFGDVTDEAMLGFAASDIEGFIDVLRNVGLTTETFAIMKALYPDRTYLTHKLSDSDIREILTEDDRGWFGKFMAQLGAGFGSLIASTGGGLEWIGGPFKYPGAGLTSIGKVVTDISEPVEDGGLGWQFVEMLPTLGSMVALSAVSFGAAGAVLGALKVPTAVSGVMTTLGATASRAQKIGSLTTGILQSMGASVAPTGFEALLEAGSTYNQLKGMGYSEEEASDRAGKVFRQNLVALGITNIPEYIAIFAPWTKIGASLPSLINRGIVRAGVKVGAIGYTALSEGGQEYYQEIIQRQAMGEDISAWAVSENLNDEDIRNVVYLGMMAGGMFAGGSAFLSFVKGNIKKNLPPDLRTEYDRLVEKNTKAGMEQGVAEYQAMEEMASNPEVAKLIELAVKVAQDQLLATQIVVNDPMRAQEINNRFAENLANSGLTNISQPFVGYIPKSVQDIQSVRMELGAEEEGQVPEGFEESYEAQKEIEDIEKAGATEQLAERVQELREKLYKQFIGKPIESGIAPTDSEIVKSENMPVEPKMTLEVAKELSGFFSEYVMSENAITAYELQRALWKKTKGERFQQFKERMEELQIEEGMPIEAAYEKAKSETLSGKLPLVSTDFFDEMTSGLREALFTVVYYNEYMQKYASEMVATFTALTNALAGKPIPRKRGTGSILFPEGGSAWDRLNFVFGEQPKVLEAIDKTSSESTTLRDAVEMIFERGMYRSKSEAFQDIEFHLSNDTEIRAFRKELEFEGQISLDSLMADKFVHRSLSKLKSKAQIEAETTELKIKLAKPPVDIKPRYEPPIEDAFKQLPMLNDVEKAIIYRIFKESGMTAIDFGNFLRANKASFDFSWWRQVAPLATGHPVNFYRSNIEAFKSLFSENAAEGNWQWITHNPRYDIYEAIRKKTGADPLRPRHPRKGGKLSEGTEEFGFGEISKLGKKLKWTKLPWIKISQRAFETGSNTMVWLCWNSYYDNAIKRMNKIASGEEVLKEGEAFDLEQEMADFQKMLADLVQRGNLGKFTEAAPVISAFAFAPRATVGKILTPRHLISANPRVRLEAWRNLGSFVAVIGGIVGLGAMLGLWDTDNDPRSADFGVVRVGNTRIDPWAGHKQMVNLYSRLVTQSGISSVTGAEYDAGIWDTLSNFVRGKSSPGFQLIMDFWTGKNFVGEDVSIADPSQWMERLAPFMILDVYEASRESSSNALISVLPGFVGAGVQTYTGNWVKDWPNLGTPKYSDNLRYGIKEPYYTTEDFWSDYVSYFKGVDPETLTEGKGYPSYIKAMIQADRIQDNLEVMSSKSLISLNTDSSEGPTFRDYYQMWRDYQDADDKEQWKKDNPEADYNLGNMTQRQYSLLVEYHSLPDHEKAEFIEEHPELAVNPRNEYLRTHPNENAQLALWGQAKLYTMEAYNEYMNLASSLDIPDKGLPYTFPSKEIAQAYFDYYDIVDDHGGSSIEAMYHRAMNDGLDDVLNQNRDELLSPVTIPNEALEIRMNPEYQKVYDQLQQTGLSDEERGVLYNTMIGDQSYYQLSKRVEAIEKGTQQSPIDPALIDAHVQYYDIKSQPDGTLYKNIESILFLIDNPDYKDFRYDSNIWGAEVLTADIDMSKEPMWRLQVANRDQEVEFDLISDKWDDMSDLDINRTPAPKDIESEDWYLKSASQKRWYLKQQDQQEYREANPSFAMDMYRIEAYKNEVPEEYFNTYIQWQSMDDQGLLTGYEDDWFMLENQGFHNDVWVGILDNQPYSIKLKMTKDGVVYLEDRNGDPSKTPPTREIGQKYLEYQELETREEKDDYRLDNPDLDEWGVAVGIWTKTMSEKRAQAGMTEAEREIAELWSRYEEWEEVLEGLGV